MNKTVKCHYCHENIDRDNAKLFKYVSSSGKSKANYYFHDECYAVFMQHRKEREDLDMVWQYIKKEIFKWDDGKTCPPHLIDRLQGLKSGQKNGYRNKGNQVFGNESGYSYEVILTTFKLCKPMIINGIADSNKFKNIQHVIDYMMTIVRNNVNDVFFRMKAKKKSDANVETISVQVDPDSKFINKTNIDENKVANKLKDIF